MVLPVKSDEKWNACCDHNQNIVGEKGRAKQSKFVDKKVRYSFNKLKGSVGII